MNKQAIGKRAIIVGAGAAGLLAAGRLGERGYSVLLLDKNDKAGRKIMITGKGRCNITSHLDISDFFPCIPQNAKFLYSALYSFTNEDIIHIMHRYGVATKVERGERVFPVSDRACDVVDALRRYALASPGVKFLQEEVDKLWIENGELKGVVGKRRGKMAADAVLIATGGSSYPRTGSTGDGYRLAQSVGHTIIPIRPSLVPLVTKEHTEEIMGLSLRNVGIVVRNAGGKIIDEDFGEMLFTHFGVSGPVILSASAHMRKAEKYFLEIDLKPALSEDKLDERLLRDFQKYTNKHFQNALDDLLPKKLIPYLVKQSGIDPHKPVHQLTAAERKTLLHLLKHLPFTIVGTRPVEEAIVTSGGVCVKEINPSTMESKKVPHLYFAGEVIDVDAYTGGFNLQIAFSTGHLAGDSMLADT